MTIKFNPYFFTKALFSDRNSCALISIGSAFNLEYEAVQRLFKLEGRRISSGTTFEQCKGVINTIALIKKIRVPYKKVNKVELHNFIRDNNERGTLIINHNEHISVIKNGIIVDAYIHTFSGKYRTDQKLRDTLKVLGYWKLP